MIATVDIKKKPRMGMVTGPQTVLYTYGDGVLQRSLVQLATYATYRTLRLDPTIALGRGLLVSGVCSSSWSVESDEGTSEEQMAAVSALLSLREEFERSVVAFGRVDFGWQGFEKVFAVKDGRITIERLKPLLHDMTHILIDEHGNFKGYRQQSMGYGTLGNNGMGGPTYPLDILAEKAFHIAFEVEAGNLYGVPLLENIRAVQTAWNDCTTYANRYDQKLAGAHWVLHYPPGTGVVNGVTTDNSEIAKLVLAALESSGTIALPTTSAEFISEIANLDVASLYEWKVELLSDQSPKQITFVNRLRYLDTLKIRGLILPERTMLEGKFGARAETAEHIDLAITHMEDLDKEIARQFNMQCVDQLLRLNWGEEMIGKVRMVPSPLVDEKIDFLRKVYEALLTGDAQHIDIGALREKLNIPSQIIEVEEP